MGNVPSKLELASAWVLIWALVALSEACAVPVTYGRTGKVLDAGTMSLAGVTGTGVAPTQGYVTNQSDGAPDRKFEGYSPGAYGPKTSSWVAILSAPAFSGEGSAAISPFGVCEVGGFLGLSRVGGELRCGASILGLDVALSAAAGVSAVGLSAGQALMYRAGLDLSPSEGFRTRNASLVPLLDVYFGYIPWQRWANDESRSDPGPMGIDRVSSNRGEYRLSVPVGLAVLSHHDSGSMRANVSFSLIPEITLAHRELADKYEPSTFDSRIEHVFTLFLMVRLEIIVRSVFADPAS